MPKKPIASELTPSKVYPDLLGRATGAAISNRLSDMPLAEDMPASRLFPDLPSAMDQDVWKEVRREREERNGQMPQG